MAVLVGNGPNFRPPKNDRTKYWRKKSLKENDHGVFILFRLKLLNMLSNLFLENIFTQAAQTFRPMINLMSDIMSIIKEAGRASYL